MKYKVIEDFVMNGVLYKKDSVIELDYKYASLKSIQKNIVKVEQNPVSIPKTPATAPVETPKAPTVEPPQTPTQPETPPVASPVAPGEPTAPTGEMGQGTPERASPAPSLPPTPSN